MKIFLIIFFISYNFIIAQSNESIYVSVNNRFAFRYQIFLKISDTTYCLENKKYYNYQATDNSLSLFVKNKNKIVFRLDSIEKYYNYDDYNTLYVDIIINKKADTSAITGLFIKSDFISQADYFCKNCQEKNFHIVTISGSKGRFKLKK